MSQHNVDLVRRIYEAFNRGDVEEAVRDIGPEFEFQSNFASLDGRGYAGREGLARHYRDIAEAWSDFTVDIRDIRARGDDQVMITYRESGRGRRSGLPLENSCWQVYDFREGRPVRMRTFRSEEAALEVLDVEVVRRMHHAFNRLDFDSATRLLSPDVEFESMFGTVEGARYTGIDGIRQYFADISQAWDEYSAEAEEIWARSGRVVAITREIARGRGSEVPLEIIGCEVWDVRDGLVVRFRGFRDEAQAAAALGPLR